MRSHVSEGEVPLAVAPAGSVRGPSRRPMTAQTRFSIAEVIDVD